ncbi:MAG: carboxypeptidase regulatory-like domain-containing protein [Bryobacteraceae bacterium]
MKRLRFLLPLSFLACLALAQDRGSITGTLTDPSGASVPDAKVVLTNPATGLSQALPSGNDGSYSFYSLPAGLYNVTVQKAGFRKVELASVRVEVNTSTRADIKMELGQLADKIEVLATASLLQTDRSDLGKVIDKRVIAALPLFANGGMRSNLAFSTLTPGVSSDLAQDPDTQAGAPRISGGSATSNTSLLVDGGESQSERRNDPQQRVVSVDGIEEFKVQTSAYSAEYGRTSNGILNYTTKSGTNEFHGSLFAQVRNRALNAKGFFYIAPLPSAQTVHNQNLEAASIGGPVWIPKIVDGRNKVFFYFSGERSRAKDIVSNSLISVPTAAARAGDFSGFLGSNGNPIPIYNPFDASGNIIANANARVQFPGNKIPPSMINPIATTILGYEPLPQNPNAFLNNNPAVNTGSRTPGENQGVYTIKGDWNKGEKLRLNGLFSRQYLNGCDICYGPNPGANSEASQENYDNRYYHFNMDYIFRPTLLNHISFNRNSRNGAEAANLRLGPNTGSYGQATQFPGVPTYSLSPLYSSYQVGSFNTYNSTNWDTLLGGTWNFKESVMWIKGKQSIKFGFEYMRVNYNGNFCNTCGGQARFSSGATSNPSVSGATGSELASFLLGVVNSGTFSFSSTANFVYPYYAAYIQDDIRLSSRLTINIGLRYDLPLPRREPNGQNSQFDPTAPNPDAGNLPGALIFAGSGPGRTGRTFLLQHRTKAFGPRAGFAYQLTSKTVVRAGGAIFYNSNKEDGAALDSITGFGGSYSTPANYYSSGISMLLPNGSSNAAAGLVPFAAAIAALTPPRVGPSIANYQSPNGYYSDGKVGQIYDYNFTVEQKFTPATMAAVSFHANYGNQTQSSQQFNQLNPKYIPIYGNLLTQSLSSIYANPSSAAVLTANGFALPYASYPLTQTLANALEPYPQYGSFGGTTNGGHSTYNAMEAQLQHTFSGGFFFQASYAFSKWISDNTSPNVYAKNVEKDLNGAWRPHVLAISYIYEIPFGRGKRYGNGLSPFVDAVLAGWRVAGVHHYQAGTTLGVSCGQNLYGAGSARCMYVPGQPLYNPNWNPDDPTSSYLNKAAFVQPGTGVFGNVGALVPGLHNPFQMTEDAALSKIFHLGGEKKTLEFRASAFNIANRHLLGGLYNNNPNTSVTSSAFGTFANPQSNLPRNVEFNLRFEF